MWHYQTRIKGVAALLLRAFAGYLELAFYKNRMRGLGVLLRGTSRSSIFGQTLDSDMGNAALRVTCPLTQDAAMVNSAVCSSCFSLSSNFAFHHGHNGCIPERLLQ